jgi:hypothetical protein
VADWELQLAASAQHLKKVIQLHIANLGKEENSKF